MRTLLLALLLFACTPSETLPDCTPGATVACACVGGGSGAQTCTSGRAYGACACPDAGAADVVGVDAAADVTAQDTAADSGAPDAVDVVGELAADAGADAGDAAVTDAPGDVRGDLGADATPDGPAPTPVSVAAGYSFACVLMSDGNVWCRGANESGQLGQGTAVAHRGLNRVPLPAPATQIVANERSACAVLDTGAILCWGGELGGGSMAPPSTAGLFGIERADIGGMVCGIPAARGPMTCRNGSVNVSPFATSITDRLSVNGNSVCALSRANPRVVLCADIRFATIEVTRTYIGEGVGREWTAIAGSRQIGGGTYFWCAIADDQSLWCWGTTRAPLSFGNGMTASSATPIQVFGPASISEVSCSGYHCLARTPTGAVYFWGSDDSTRTVGRAEIMPGITGVRGVSAHHNTSCLMYADHVECRGIDGLTSAFVTL